MRLLVTGGRAYWDKEELYRVLDKIAEDYSVSVVIHGAATGADTLAGYWAEDRGIEVIPVPAEWNLYGRQAGHIRNRLMLEQYKPDLVVAFPGGRGTRNMVTISKKAGIEVIEL
jgi:glutamine amidotransferase PdxT